MEEETHMKHSAIFTTALFAIGLLMSIASAHTPPARSM